MKIAVVCANGKEGRLIVEEALKRGADVTAVVRGENLSATEKVITKDLFDLTKDDLKGFDVVIDAFGAWTPDTVTLHSPSLQHLCDILSGADTRLLVVGGAGSLYTDSEHKTQVIDKFDFPEAAMPVLINTGKALDDLRKRDDIKWTYISPAIDFRADGKKAGEYTLGGEELLLNSKGESTISYADYAVAMVDEALNGNHIKQRISVVSK